MRTLLIVSLATLILAGCTPAVNPPTTQPTTNPVVVDVDVAYRLAQQYILLAYDAGLIPPAKMQQIMLIRNSVQAIILIGENWQNLNVLTPMTQAQLDQQWASMQTKVALKLKQ